MIAERLSDISAALPEGVRLVAVSKFHPSDAVREAYAAGQRLFGENRVREMVEKEAVLRPDCPDLKWHMIGVLQRNKVKYIAPFVDVIESISSIELLAEVQKQAEKNGRIIGILLQVHIAREETKSGFLPEKLRAVAEQIRDGRFPDICLRGLMGMATLTEEKEVIRAEFRLLHDLFTELKTDFFKNSTDFNDLSMGMSDDYRTAIEEGSNIIRIGTAIFGDRVH